MHTTYVLHDTETMSRLVRGSVKIMCYRKYVISENYSGHGMSHDTEEPPRDPHGLGLIYLRASVTTDRYEEHGCHE